MMNSAVSEAVQVFSLLYCDFFLYWISCWFGLVGLKNGFMYMYLTPGQHVYILSCYIVYLLDIFIRRIKYSCYRSHIFNQRYPSDVGISSSAHVTWHTHRKRSWRTTNGPWPRDTSCHSMIFSRGWSEAVSAMGSRCSTSNDGCDIYITVCVY